MYSNKPPRYAISFFESSPKFTKAQLVELVRQSGIDPHADMTDVLAYDMKLMKDNSIRIWMYEAGPYPGTSKLKKEMIIKESDISSAPVKQTYRSIVADMKRLMNLKDFESHYSIYLAYYHPGGPEELHKFLHARLKTGTNRLSTGDASNLQPAPASNFVFSRSRRPSFSSILGNSPVPNNVKKATLDMEGDRRANARTKKASKKMSKPVAKTRGRPKKNVSKTVAAPAPAPVHSENINYGQMATISGFRVPKRPLPSMSFESSNSNSANSPKNRTKRRKFGNNNNNIKSK